MVRFVLLTVLLAGCPKGGNTPKPQAGIGCPAASDVYIASWSQPQQDATKGGGWVLPLHDKVVDTFDKVGPYDKIDAATAVSAGAPAPPQNLWLMLPQKGGIVPCRVTYGMFYQAAIDGPTKNITYGVELSGCGAPADPNIETVVALASPEPPGQCQVIAPKIAERIGEDKDGKWSRPTKETPLPPAFVVPQKDCAAPCEKLWVAGSVEIGGKMIAAAGAVNWLTPTNGCEWTGDKYFAFFIGDKQQTQEHPQPLFAVLADSGGPKAVIASGPGEYTVYDPAGNVGHHLVWLVPHPDSYNDVVALGPDCAQ